MSSFWRAVPEPTCTVLLTCRHQCPTGLRKWEKNPTPLHKKFDRLCNLSNNVHFRGVTGLKTHSSTCEEHVQPLTQSLLLLSLCSHQPQTAAKHKTVTGEKKKLKKRLWKGNNENQAKQERGSEKVTPQGLANSLVDGPQPTDGLTRARLRWNRGFCSWGMIQWTQYRELLPGSDHPSVLHLWMAPQSPGKALR